MHDAHRRYLVLEQGIGAALFNFLLNGAIAWVLFRSLESVPLWGDQSIAGDTIGTTFLLPVFTCLIVTRLARSQLASGRLPAIPWPRSGHAALRLLPARTWVRAVVLGLVCLVVAAPPVIWGLQALGVESMGFWRFVAFKATFAAVLAAVFTPLIALSALADGLSPAVARP
jgi:hypothetical protein